MSCYSLHSGYYQPSQGYYSFSGGVKETPESIAVPDFKPVGASKLNKNPLIQQPNQQQLAYSAYQEPSGPQHAGGKARARVASKGVKKF